MSAVIHKYAWSYSTYPTPAEKRAICGALTVAESIAWRWRAVTCPECRRFHAELAAEERVT